MPLNIEYENFPHDHLETQDQDNSWCGRPWTAETDLAVGSNPVAMTYGSQAEGDGSWCDLKRLAVKT